jgi:putative transposase
VKKPHVVLFGMTSFTRASIPDILSDFENMPSVDDTALDEEKRKHFLRNLEAVRLFVQEPGVSLTEIQKATGVWRNELYLLLSRMVEKDIDGRIKGLRALLPYRHHKPYERTAAVHPRSVRRANNASGAYDQLIRKHPKLATWLKKVATERTTPLRPGEIRAVRKPVRDLHGQWLAACAKCGVTLSEWPFNYDDRGFRTFQEKLSMQEKASRISIDRDKSPPSAISKTAEAAKELSTSWPIALNPFDIVQFDGHKIDVRLTLRVPDPFGMETVFELHRIWILVVTIC